MVRSGDFDPKVPLPPGLDVSAIRRAIEYIEKELSDFVDSLECSARKRSPNTAGSRSTSIRTLLRNASLICVGEDESAS